MATATHPCPECGGSDRREEDGEYALVGLTNGRLQLHVNKDNEIDAVIVRATVCQNCRQVTLYESP